VASQHTYLSLSSSDKAKSSSDTAPSPGINQYPQDPNEFQGEVEVEEEQEAEGFYPDEYDSGLYKWRLSIRTSRFRLQTRQSPRLTPLPPQAREDQYPQDPNEFQGEVEVEEEQEAEGFYPDEYDSQG
jgi:hypothetical protein